MTLIRTIFIDRNFLLKYATERCGRDHLPALMRKTLQAGKAKAKGQPSLLNCQLVRLWVLGILDKMFKRLITSLFCLTFGCRGGITKLKYKI